MAVHVFRYVLVLAVALPTLAFAARSEFSPADNAQLRLLLTRTEEGTKGGIEILLEPGWYTYWRNPGEAGVAPVFDFSGSENVANVDVAFPVPVRHDDGASVSLIYENEVVFPLRVEAVDANADVTLRLKAEFGVCREVCIPSGASAEVTLAKDAGPDPLANARLREFVRRVPKAPDRGWFDVETVTVEDADALSIEVRTPDSTYTDLFADPPSGWYIGQPVFMGRIGGVSRYRLSLAGKPRDAQVAGQTFRFVAVAGGEAIEESVKVP